MQTKRRARFLIVMLNSLDIYSLDSIKFTLAEATGENEDG